MKWLVFLAMLAAVPAIIEWLRSNPRHSLWVCGLLGLLLFIYAPYNLAMSPYPWPMWPGYVKGIKVTAIDAVALAIVISYRGRGYKSPFRWPLIFYLGAVLFAATQSVLPLVSLFYVWQLLRVYLVYKAVQLVAQYNGQWNAVIGGLIVGVAFQSLEAGWARAHGAVQSGGTLGHQNLLGMLTNMVLMPSLAMTLAGIRVRWSALGILVSAAALVFTASRAAISIAALGVVLVVLLSLIRRPTQGKARMASMAILFLCLAAPFAMSSLSNRFQGSGISLSVDDDEVRTRMVHAAEMMIADHPLGVGSNQFVVTANKGQYWLRAQVPQTRGNMGAHVHNSYLLVEAETGLSGLIAMLIILGTGICYPIYAAFKNKGDPRGDVLVGLSIGLVTFALQNRVEWGFVSENVQYMLAVIFGLITGISRAIDVAASNRRAQWQMAKARDRSKQMVPTT